MEAIIVPCTRKKIWDHQPNAGPVAAKNAYIYRPFKEDWKPYAEKTCTEGSGNRWFILSTKYGLIEPDKLIKKYTKGISKAEHDPEFQKLLQKQGDELGLKHFDRVFLMGKEEQSCGQFMKLVDIAIGNGKAQCESM